MAFITIGGGYKLIKNTDLEGKEGMEFMGYFIEVDRGGKYPNPKIICIAKSDIKFFGKDGKEVHIKAGERFGVAGGTMLGNKAGQATTKALSLLTFEGKEVMKEGPYKGNAAARWSFAQDTSDMFDNYVPTQVEMGGTKDDLI